FDNTEQLISLFRAYQNNPAEMDWLAQEYETRVCLNAIYGWSEVLMMGLVGEVTLNQQDVFTEIKVHIVYLVNQMNNLLNYERCRQNLPMLILAGNPLTALTDHYPPGIDHYRQNFTLDVRYEGDITQNFACTDALILTLDLLLDNIVRHARAAHVTLQIHNVDGKLRVQLEDNGMGVLLSDHPDRVFEPFFQVDIHAGGLGLGLYLAQQHIASHHGTMRMQTAPGAGTTIMMTIPLL
ncbi:MAG: ATP-binding protein, partial [Aggregatilineales bacterium]